MDLKWLEELAALGAGGVVAAAFIWYYRRDVITVQQHMITVQQRIEQQLTDILAAVQRLHDDLK